VLLSDVGIDGIAKQHQGILKITNAVTAIWRIMTLEFLYGIVQSNSYRGANGITNRQ
jgi:hypothetical protein